MPTSASKNRKKLDTESSVTIRIDWLISATRLCDASTLTNTLPAIRVTIVSNLDKKDTNPTNWPFSAEPASDVSVSFETAKGRPLSSTDDRMSANVSWSSGTDKAFPMASNSDPAKNETVKDNSEDNDPRELVMPRFGRGQAPYSSSFSSSKRKRIKCIPSAVKASCFETPCNSDLCHVFMSSSRSRRPAFGTLFVETHDRSCSLVAKTENVVSDLDSTEFATRRNPYALSKDRKYVLVDGIEYGTTMELQMKAIRKVRRASKRQIASLMARTQLRVQGAARKRPRISMWQHRQLQAARRETKVCSDTMLLDGIECVSTRCIVTPNVRKARSKRGIHPLLLEAVPVGESMLACAEWDAQPSSTSNASTSAVDFVEGRSFEHIPRMDVLDETRKACGDLSSAKEHLSFLEKSLFNNGKPEHVRDDADRDIDPAQPVHAHLDDTLKYARNDLDAIQNRFMSFDDMQFEYGCMDGIVCVIASSSELHRADRSLETPLDDAPRPLLREHDDGSREVIHPGTVDWMLADRDLNWTREREDPADNAVRMAPDRVSPPTYAPLPRPSMSWSVSAATSDLVANDNEASQSDLKRRKRATPWWKQCLVDIGSPIYRSDPALGLPLAQDVRDGEEEASPPRLVPTPSPDPVDCADDCADDAASEASTQLNLECMSVHEYCK